MASSSRTTKSSASLLCLDVIQTPVKSDGKLPEAKGKEGAEERNEVVTVETIRLPEPNGMNGERN